MSITMRSGEHSFLDAPPGASPGNSPGRHRVTGQRPATFYSLFALREFRALWSAQFASLIGDQVAQVAIAVLVYAKTGSAWITALAYTLTYLPPIVGGPLLAGIADAFPRRQVMITLDLVRAGLVELMALPQVPLAGTCLLLFTTGALGTPFGAARTAMLEDVLRHDRLPAGSAAGHITFQSGQVAGFLLGGLLAASVGPYRVLALDALTFCISAAVIARWVRPRPAPATKPGIRLSPRRAGGGGAVIARKPLLRTLVLFACLAGFAVVPEGIAVPYAHALGGGAATAGLLMMIMPAGMVTGAMMIRRLARPDEQVRMIGSLAMLSCAPLAVSLFAPSLWALLVLWALSGAGSSYQIAAANVFARSLAPGERVPAFAAAQTAMLTAQALGILTAGAATGRLGPQAVVGIAGVAGTIVAAVLASEWARHRRDLPGVSVTRAPGPAGEPAAPPASPSRQGSRRARRRG
jgi:MFS family permease